MKTAKIKIPKGFEIYNFDKKTGEATFKLIPRNMMSIIKTVDDVLKDNGISKTDFEKQNEHLTEDEIAYRIIKLLAISLNEGWLPNWDDSSEYKYVPWFKMGSSAFRYYGYDRWGTFTYVGSRLCFKSSELATYAGEQFIDVYKKYMLIN